MNLEETFQLLALVHSLSTYESRESEQALSMKAQAWAAVLEDVPFGFAQQFVIEQARSGVSVREAARVAGAWSERRRQVIREATAGLVPPDELPAGSQGAWLQVARRAVGDGAPVGEASDFADRQLGVVRALPSGRDSVVVPVEESIDRIRRIAARWGLERAQEASNRER